jgi:indole-3-glycerol phosphate synthase
MSVLDRIFETKREELQEAKRRVSLADVRALARDESPARDFASALSKPTALKASAGVGLIAEIKKASPSQGVIRSHFDPGEIASIYEAEGAHALSVLTDVRYFQGGLDNLRMAREATNLPCLRKDFLEDEYQVYEARAWGADAVLLIAAWLDDVQIAEFQGLAAELGMAALVEVHTLSEAERVAALNCPLVGVNNRNLADFTTDLGTTERLMPILSQARVRVSESALETRADLDRVRAAGADAVLIGTSFCAADDIGAKVREVFAV